MASRRKSSTPGPAPNEGTLHEAALAALGVRALTRVELERTLSRRIATWAMRSVRAGLDEEEIAAAAARARELVVGVAQRMVENGLVNDAAFARARASRLSRAGRSRRAISSHLAAKGVEEGTVRDALPSGAEDELRAALVFARKKRLGPFGRADDDEADREARARAKNRALGAFARAGFGFDLAERVLRMAREEADEHLREVGAW